MTHRGSAGRKISLPARIAHPSDGGPAASKQSMDTAEINAEANIKAFAFVRERKLDKKIDPYTFLLTLLDEE